MSRVPLVDLAVDVVRVAGAVGSATDAGALRREAKAALEAFATAAAGADPAAIEDARYALVALIDERALAASSPVRAAWLDRPLQLEFYRTFAAGEGFFRRLEAWRHPRRAEDAEVLEVFHACLALGFRGRLADADGEAARRQLLADCAGEILAGRVSGAAPPPAATGTATRTVDDPWRWRGLPLWVSPAGCALGVGLVWLAGRWWILLMAARLATELR